MKRINTGYAKVNKVVRNEYPRENLFSYEFGAERGQMNTANSNRNKMSIEKLNRQSLMRNNEYILQVENLVHKNPTGTAENERRSTFYGGFGYNNLNPLLNQEKI